MKYTFSFITVLFLLNIGCNPTIKSNQIEKQNDSLFIASQEIPEDIKDIAYSNDYFITKDIGENIEFNIIKIKNGYSYCFIKEKNNNNINRHLVKFGDFIYYIIYGDYSDTATITRDWEIIVDNMRNYDNTNCESLLSPDFWEIPKYRLQNYNNREKPTDINKLENLVNNLESFENYKIDSEFHNNILKELFVLTQISLLMYGNYDEYCDNMQSVPKIFSYENVKNLRTVDQILWKKNKKTMNKWQEDNINFLITKIDTIQAEIESKNNVFYFFTDDDKLFRLEINLIEGKIKLNKDYVNKHFMQEDPIWFFLKNRYGPKL